MDEGRTRYLAGCMTGTSLDGLDVAIAAVTGRGLALQARLLGHAPSPLGEAAAVLRRLASGQAATPLEYLRAARKLGEIHAHAVADAAAAYLPAGRRLDLIVAHGQTIWHAPAEHLTWQLFDPWPLVRRLGVPVCHDLRQADLVAGGQGAPLTPLADWVLYRHPQVRRCIVNLGGICNVTDLPPGSTPRDVRGEDVGPCNLLIDGLVQRLVPGAAFDQDGIIASRGRADPRLLSTVRQSPFFSRPRPRTTGREDFSAEWIQAVLSASRGMGVEDAVASAVDAVAALVVAAAGPAKDGGEVILAGGGAMNPILRAAIEHKAGSRCHVRLSDELGIPSASREALGWAVLGALAQDGECTSLPHVTGATAPPPAATWSGLGAWSHQP